MNPIKLNFKIYSLVPFILIGVYGLLTLISLNFGFFWDVIQQISKEAHWFYLTDFSSLLMPTQNSGAEIVATGYHPPLMGIITAALWKLFGYKLWVMHLFSFGWFILLIFNTYKILLRFFNNENTGWILLLVLLESTLLTQFVIASPDFILLTAFVISLRAIFDRNNFLLSVGILFLCCINMRGIFVGLALFVSHLFLIYTQFGNKLNIRHSLKITIAYLPALFVLMGYFTYYFLSRGWFFSDENSTGHYALPGNLFQILKHLAEFGLRSIENGRVVIWGFAALTGYFTLKNKINISNEYKFLLVIFMLLSGLYLFFVFITRMPFSSRYFMPQFFILTIITSAGIVKFFNNRNIKITFLLILFFELTGNIWIYPDKIAKSWDCTLAHLPYYELRQECFYYIDHQNIDYNEIAGGFCIYGNRAFVELDNTGKVVGSEPNRRYFIHSNISNNEDSLVLELNDCNKWTRIKRFEKGFVFIEIYENILFSNKTHS